MERSSPHPGAAASFRQRGPSVGWRSLGAEHPWLQSWLCHRPLAPAVSPTEMSQSCPASGSSASPDAATGNRQEPSGDWRTWVLARSRPGPPGALRRQGHESFCPGTLGECHARRWLAQMTQAGPSKLTRGEEASFHQAFNYSDRAVLGLIASETTSPSSAPLSSSRDRLLGANPGPCPAQGPLTSFPAGAPDVVC